MATIEERYKVGILTCSTSRSKKEDITAQELKRFLKEPLLIQSIHNVSKQNPHCKDFRNNLRFKVVQYAVVPDKKKNIAETLQNWCDTKKLDLILTTGGTGFSPTDVTPEATKSILDREANNLAEAMRRFSTSPKNNRLIPYLSRGVCGLRKKTLILNLPGSPQGSLDSLKALYPLLPHILKLISTA